MSRQSVRTFAPAVRKGSAEFIPLSYVKAITEPSVTERTVGWATSGCCAGGFGVGGTSETRPRFNSLAAEHWHSQSAVAAVLCRRTPNVPHVAYPAYSSVSHS